MRRTIIGAVAVACLLAAAPADAKQVTAARVCGAAACTDIKDRATLAVLPEGGDPTDPPAGGAGWYRMTLWLRAEGASDSFTVAVVPSKNLLRGSDGTWMPMGGEPARAIARITARLEPLPAAELRGVGPVATRRSERAPGGGDGVPIAALAMAALAALAIAALAARRIVRHRRGLGGAPGPAAG